MELEWRRKSRIWAFIFGDFGGEERKENRRVVLFRYNTKDFPGQEEDPGEVVPADCRTRTEPPAASTRSERGSSGDVLPHHHLLRNLWVLTIKRDLLLIGNDKTSGGKKSVIAAKKTTQ
ncbi:hypothetical protein U1Q18_017389 [Sarracenia purpurea var. burkii]